MPLTPERTAAALVSGLLLGSFLNVCIARLPSHRSIAWPGSHCPRCGAAIRPLDNIPLLSFALLRGRCRSCGKPIALRYPLIEAALPLLFIAAAARFPSDGAALEAGAFLFRLLGLFCMDAETLLLPACRRFCRGTVCRGSWTLPRCCPSPFRTFNQPSPACWPL